METILFRVPLFLLLQL
ncbi:hypothetical protein RDABS01_014024 [Bienertia sinuspersici]